MTVMAVNADDGVPLALIRAARDLPPGAPVVAMVHGYRYSPRHPAHDPHRGILAPEGGRGGLSWPRALGFTGDPSQGLAIAFGWEARGRLRAAYDGAEQAGGRLAVLADRVAQASGRPVGLIGHSLGGRVALQALRRAGPGSLGRLILLNAAEFQDAAEQALAGAGAAGAEVLNVTARENDPFDFALEQLLSRGRRRALGAGLAQPRPAWVDLQIDDAATLDALADLGFPTARGARLMSHWSPCLREGLFDLYRAALCHPWALPLGLLRHHIPVRPEPRWSRLRAAPALLRA